MENIKPPSGKLLWSREYETSVIQAVTTSINKKVHGGVSSINITGESIHIRGHLAPGANNTDFISFRMDNEEETFCCGACLLGSFKILRNSVDLDSIHDETVALIAVMIRKFLYNDRANSEKMKSQLIVSFVVNGEVASNLFEAGAIATGLFKCTGEYLNDNSGNWLRKYVIKPLHKRV